MTERGGTEVLHVCAPREGGCRRHVLDLAPALAAEGFRSALASGGFAPDELSALTAAGVDTIELPLVRDPSPASDTAAFLALRHLLSSGRFALVHGHSSKAAFLARLAGRSAGVPAVVTHHGPGYQGFAGFRRRLFRALERLAAPWARAVVALSEGERAFLLAEGLARAGQIELIGNGLDAARLGPDVPREAARAALGLPESGFLAGFVGRLAPQKDPLAAVAIARAAGVPLLVCGDGPLEAECRAAAPEARFLGWREDVGTVYRALDVLLFPSRFEAHPYVPMEAAACGLPVVACDVAGVRESVEPGVSGAVVALGDLDGAARALAALAADPALRAAQGEAARRRARTFPAVAESARRTACLYRRVLGEWTSRAGAR